MKIEQSISWEASIQVENEEGEIEVIGNVNSGAFWPDELKDGKDVIINPGESREWIVEVFPDNLEENEIRVDFEFTINLVNGARTITYNSTVEMEREFR
jgi:hypothetical protein